MELSSQQKLVLYHLVNGVKDKNLKQQTLGGYAGTGKTTLIKYLRQFFPDYGVCAYTGKAANVLRRKGVGGATTIHSRIYKPFFQDGKVYFDLNPDPGCDGFIVDEASMVSEEIYEDLCSYDMPMIFVGDHGQLEPIGSDFNLMQSPDHRLEELHRNAGDIARFSDALRRGYSSRGFGCRDGSVEIVHKVTIDDYCAVDQVICAYNSTRVQINKEIRDSLGFAGILNVGERVMCLRNNRTLGLFNGMQGTVVDLYDGRRGRKLMDFEFDGFVHQGIWYDPEQFGKETHKIVMGKDTINPFDYAYCITAHKAQGDEWERVLVIEQRCRNWDHKRWAYTAASRPKSKLIWKIVC